ncbi:universal stress protein, partial [Halorubrum sp. SD626R]|uniref:universal stress protein n=2 Tax=Halorubrum TaxID=56688 RepID=UPI0010F5B47D
MSADSDASDSPNSPSTVTHSPAAAPSGSDSAGSLFDRVLVVTADTDAGRAAVDAGVEIAATHGASVDALYVVDTTEHWDMAVERHEREGETLVEAAESRGAAVGVDVDKWFRYGTAHEEVLDFAASHDADLIVVGSARRTGLDRLVHPETLPV